MSRRRLIAFVVAVLALIALVALAAVGRPLGKTGGGGNGLPPVFWDFLFTSVVIVFGLAIVATLTALLYLRRERPELQVLRSSTARALALLIAFAAIVAFIGWHINFHHLFNRPGATTAPKLRPPGGLGGGGGKAGYNHVRLEWPEIVVFLGVLLAAGVIYATRARDRLPIRRRVAAPPELVAALDESLDDLRSDPDLRRAIVAAYARMERALAAAGVPRRPAEAPLEYLERVLLSLDASAGPVRRLTDLFEWARFSQHEPEPSMRDEAVDALVAIRDELREAEPQPVETW